MVKNAKFKKIAAVFLAAAMAIPMAVTGFAAGYSVDFAGKTTEVESTATTATAEFELSISDNLYGFAVVSFELDYDKNILAIENVRVNPIDPNGQYDIIATPAGDTVYYMVFNSKFQDSVKTNCATVSAEFDIKNMAALMALGTSGTNVALKFYKNDVNCVINAQEDIVSYMDGELDVTDTPANICVKGTVFQGYNVTVNSPAHGRATGNPVSNLREGDEITVTTNMDLGYKAGRVTAKTQYGDIIEAASTDGGLTWKFNMPASNVVVDVEEEAALAYAININADNDGPLAVAQVNGVNVTKVSQGDVVTIVSNRAGKKIVTISGTDAKGNPITFNGTTFTMPDADVNITVTLRGGGGDDSPPTTRWTLTYRDGDETVATETYLNNTNVSLTKTLVKNGYMFSGWFSDEELTNEVNSVKIDGNKTVYAKWVNDRFNFVNSTNAFFGNGQRGTYALTGEYLKLLQKDRTAAEWLKIKNAMNSTWGGSCFGMSAVYLIRYMGNMNPGVFQTDANLLYDFVTPAESEEIKNLVNYYFLQQFAPNGSCGYFVSKAVQGGYNRDLVNIMSENDGSVMVNYIFGDRYYTEEELKSYTANVYGHSVVALDYTKNADGSHTFTVLDPNQRVNDKITISSDFMHVTFASGRYSYARIINIQSAANSVNTFDKYNVQKNIYPNLMSVFGGEDVTQYITSLSTYTVTAADGRYIKFVDGKLVEDTLDVEIQMPISDNPSGVLWYILPGSESLTLSAPSDEAGSVKMQIGDTLVEIESEGLKEVAMNSEGKVTVHSDSAAKQEITVTSDALGSEYNSMKVSGKDTGISVKVKEGGVEVASENDAYTSIKGVNVFTDEESRVKNVFADKNGTDVNSSELTAVNDDSVPERIPGDINGDGNKNNKDITRLMRFVKYRDVEAVMESLDVNGDGEVNNKDITRLMRYIKYKDVDIN